MKGLMLTLLLLAGCATVTQTVDRGHGLYISWSDGGVYMKNRVFETKTEADAFLSKCPKCGNVEMRDATVEDVADYVLRENGWRINEITADDQWVLSGNSTTPLASGKDKINAIQAAVVFQKRGWTLRMVSGVRWEVWSEREMIAAGELASEATDRAVQVAAGLEFPGEKKRSLVNTLLGIK